MALRYLDRTCSHSFLTLVFKDPQGKPQETEAGYALGQEKCLRKEPLFKSFFIFYFLSSYGALQFSFTFSGWWVTSFKVLFLPLRSLFQSPSKSSEPGLLHWLLWGAPADFWSEIRFLISSAELMQKMAFCNTPPSPRSRRPQCFFSAWLGGSDADALFLAEPSTILIPLTVMSLY